jgi:hypothetical protein
MTRAAFLGLSFTVGVGMLCAAGPEQPIHFSHKLHVEQQKMQCTNCHQLATKSRHSGLPTANLCMACHIVIKADSVEIKKVAEYKKKGEAIPWVRLYQLPNFVYYSHRRHVNSGIACNTCHGSTGTTDVSEATRTFTMRFCMDCHREKGASNDCATCHQ